MRKAGQGSAQGSHQKEGHGHQGKAAPRANDSTKSGTAASRSTGSTDGAHAGSTGPHRRQLGEPRESESVRSVWAQEGGGMCTLVLLYMLQGIPMGLTLGAL